MSDHDSEDDDHSSDCDSAEDLEASEISESSDDSDDSVDSEDCETMEDQRRAGNHSTSVQEASPHEITHKTHRKNHIYSNAAEICDLITKYNENPEELSTFSVGGEIEGPCGVPAVHVDGVGRIAYPLCKEQTVTLLSVANQAPFGKGKETVVDVEVRRAWQINSNLVHINDCSW